MDCLVDLAKCHYDASLGRCCSNTCIPNEGEPYGYCKISTVTTITASSSIPTSLPTRPPGRQTTKRPRPCLKEGARCNPDGSLGNCCSTNCWKVDNQDGTCRGSEPPTGIPIKCLRNDEYCMANGSMGFCCSDYCKVLYPHEIGVCETKLPNPTPKPTTPSSISFISDAWIISISISLIAIVGIVGILLIWLYRRQQRLEVALSRKEVDHFFSGDMELSYLNGYAHENAASMPYNKDLEIAADAFTVDWANPLGQGCFGVVLKGKINNVVTVAVKTLRSSSTPESGTYLRALLCEIKVLQHIGLSENVVSMLGCHTSKLETGKVFLFLEFCPLGSLEIFLRSNKYSFLQKQSGKKHYGNHYYENVREPAAADTSGQMDSCQIDLKDLMTWSMQITNAMRYLAEKKVIHADLATRNVLLLRKDCAKLTDFGLSRRLYEYGNYVKKNQEPLPWRWMALESLQQLQFSHQSDVWSLGVTIWEIYSLGDVPFPGLTWNTEFVSQLENNLRPAKPLSAPNPLYDLLLDCWKPIPTTRPTFRQIYNRLYEFSNHVEEIK